MQLISGINRKVIKQYTGKSDLHYERIFCILFVFLLENREVRHGTAL